MNKETNSFEYKKRIEENLKAKKEENGESIQNDNEVVGKYLNKKRKMNLIIGINSRSDHIYMKSLLASGK